MQVSALLPPPRPVCSLPSTERLIVWGMRQWARCRTNQVSPRGSIEAAFAGFGMVAAAAPLCLLLEIAWHSWPDPLLFGAPCMPAVLSPDEQLLLDVVRAANGAGEGQIIRSLDDMLPPTLIERLLTQARRIAQALSA